MYFYKKFLQHSQSHCSIFGHVGRNLRAFIFRRVVHIAVVHSRIDDVGRVARVRFQIENRRLCLRETVFELADRRALAVGLNLDCDVVER